jgi:diguanylate cyclase (GGDEF)-like protein
VEVEALLEWYDHVLRRVFFPDAVKQSIVIMPPAFVLQIYQKETEKTAVDKPGLERLTLIYDDLYKAAEKLIAEGASGEKPSLASYDSMSHLMESYIIHLRRVQKDIADAGMSVDSLTGLRTVSGMFFDLQKEQDRFDRKGTSFSIANLQIDRMQEIQERYERRAQDEIVAYIGKVIAKTIRSFDDAYYLGKGEYMVALKHVEFIDACSVMDRMRQEISGSHFSLGNGNKISLTLSFGIAEAMPREKVVVVIDHAKEALQSALKEGGNRIQEYLELSALGQYAREASRDNPSK